MRTTRKITGTVPAGILILTLLTIPGPAPGLNDSKTLKGRLDSLIQAFPARDILERDRLAAELAAMGPRGIREMCSLLTPPGIGKDSGVRFALHALAVYVRRTGAEKERIMTARAFHKALKLTPHKEVRAFLIGQIQLIGGHESVDPLREYLHDSRLADPASRALLAIGTPAAEKALLKGLKRADRGSRLTLVQALGELRSRESVKPLLALAAGEEQPLRQAARSALANIGDPRAESILESMPVNSSVRERERAVDTYMLFLRRRVEDGDGEAVLSKLKNILRHYEPDAGSSVSSRALELLVDIEGAEALDELLSAAESVNPGLRGQALFLADRVGGTEATARWGEKLSSDLPADWQADIIAMLARRGDVSALPGIKRKLDSDDPVIRKAAIPAAARLAGESVLNDLLSLLESADREEIELIKQAGLGFPGDRIVSEADRLLRVSAPPVQIALIEIMASRQARRFAGNIFPLAHSEDPELKNAVLNALPSLVDADEVPRILDYMSVAENKADIALLQNALVAAAGRIEEPEDRAALILAELERTDPRRRPDLLRPLARIGGEKALNAVVSAIWGEDESLRTPAVYTLVQWEDPAAMPALLKLAKETSKAKHRYLAVQGFIRLLNAREDEPDTRFESIRRVQGLIASVEEKNLFLDGLARIRSIPSMREAARFLDEGELGRRAVRTMLRIGLPDMGEPGLPGREALELLLRIKDRVDDEYERERVVRHIETLQEEEKFQTLFNGRDLKGWIGGGAYRVEDGVIAVQPREDAGNLFTEREYADFELRFEFKLTPGANNGLGIRAPLDGDAAYSGMEIQILDDSASRYSDLKPYQYHGSIYGVEPARKGFQRPVGEWNSQVVIARGTHIVVRLNGVTIVDTDIALPMKEGAMDGRPHPGLERKSGHIGFLGHGSRIEIRNIRIRELK